MCNALSYNWHQAISPVNADNMFKNHSAIITSSCGLLKSRVFLYVDKKCHTIKSCTYFINFIKKNLILSNFSPQTVQPKFCYQLIYRLSEGNDS